MQPGFALTRNDEDEDEARAQEAARQANATARRHTGRISESLANMGNELRPDDSASTEEVLAIPSRVTEIRTQSALQEALFDLLADAARSGSDFSIEELGDAVAAGFDWAQAHAEAIDWASAYQFELVGMIDESTRNFLADEITDWMESGEPLSELRERLTWTFGEERAARIAQTEASRGFAHGSLASYRASGVVNQVRWYTVVDDRVCVICGGLHGTTSDAQEPDFGGIDAPPAHPGCRCRIAPVID